MTDKNTGFIALRRSLIDWEWWDDHNATRLLIYLLIAVNHKPKNWRGIVINAGDIATSWESLSKNVGLTISQCRTSMDKLESSGEVTRRKAPKYQLVTLTKWAKFQVEPIKVTSKLASKSQVDDKQIASKSQQLNKSITYSNNGNNENKEKGEKVFSPEVLNFYNSVVSQFTELYRPKKEADKKKWLEVIDKVNRIDGYDFKLLYRIIYWARNDDFWFKNFQSILKLRKKNNDGILYVDYFKEIVEPTVSKKSNQIGVKKIIGRTNQINRF